MCDSIAKGCGGWWMVGVAGDQLRERANRAEIALLHAQSELSALRSADTEKVRARAFLWVYLGNHPAAHSVVGSATLSPS
jgi:hypothetical protein